MRFVLALVFMVSLAFVSGCSSTMPNVAATPANTVCPIMGGKVVADGGSTEWNGQTIGFCCEGCLPKWDELTDDEKTTKLAEADQNKHDGHADHDHGTHDH